jgi:hypothetical protein
MNRINFSRNVVLALCCGCILAQIMSGQQRAQSPPASSPAPPAGVDPQLAQDPRLAQLTPEYRQFVLSEVPSSKTYCQNNALISGLMDCTCFSKAVFDYRITHVNDVSNGPKGKTPSPLVNVIGSAKLDCSQCLPDDKIMKWAADTVRSGMVGVAPARSQTIADCVGKGMATGFKAQPYLYLVQSLYNQTVLACNK